MRHIRITATILACSLVACNSAGRLTPGAGSDNTLVETAEYTGIIISEHGASEFSYLFDSSTEFWEPSVRDVSRAEARIKRFVASLQSAPKIESYLVENVAFISDNLATYRRQYVGIVVDGERRIWCNLFYKADSFPHWMSLPVDVDGGGRHYWQIEYVPIKDECRGFAIHGES